MSDAVAAAVIAVGVLIVIALVVVGVLVMRALAARSLDSERPARTAEGDAAAAADLAAALEVERSARASAEQAAAEARRSAAEAAAHVTTAVADVQAQLVQAKAASRLAETELASLRARLAEEQEKAARLAASKAEDAHRITEEAARLSARQARVIEREERMTEREDRITEREDRLTAREERVSADAAAAQKQKDVLTRDRAALDQRAAQLDHAVAEQTRALERIAGLTADDAARELVATIEEHAKRQAAISVRDLEAEARREADRRAREITSQAIQRVASQQTSESVVSVLHLPSDEMKGRIIGREGRNIRTFETLTGVNVLIDDTPEAVALSCFDPVRREIARITLDSLVADGRIHPQRIEDAYEQAKVEVESTIAATGQDVMLEVGLGDAHPELITLLGRLRYRTSYGQNVLRHLVETAHIASGMAAELGLGRDGIAIVKRAAFFHDIGKALTHEVEGSHALVGAEVAKRCGESEEVVHAIAAHHLEVQPQTVEAWLTIGSDSCSGGRPGARRESLESYVDRLKRIEEIANSREGVERVFAMSAGRELRVMVLPDEVDDLGAQVLARDIAKQIEDELTYPGQIRVTVVRESRATETAH